MSVAHKLLKNVMVLDMHNHKSIVSKTLKNSSLLNSRYSPVILPHLPTASIANKHNLGLLPILLVHTTQIR